MFSRRQIKIISSIFVIILSILAVFSSGNSSTSSSPFKSEVKQTDIKNSQVEGASVSGAPLTSSPVGNQDVTAAEGQQSYQVVNVVDGDTIDVDMDGEKTRLRIIGMDTPETVDPRKSVQCYGKEASNKAKEILTGQYVLLEADVTQGDKDKYGRSLRYVFLPNGTDYGLYMISEGYAHEYTYNTPYKYQDKYKQAEIDARNGDKGLWSPSTCNGNK